MLFTFFHKSKYVPLFKIPSSYVATTIKVIFPKTGERYSVDIYAFLALVPIESKSATNPAATKILSIDVYEIFFAVH